MNSSGDGIRFAGESNPLRQVAYDCGRYEEGDTYSEAWTAKM